MHRLIVCGLCSLGALVVTGCEKKVVTEDELVEYQQQLTRPDKKGRLDKIEERQAEQKEVIDWFKQRPALTNMAVSDFEHLQEMPRFSSRLTAVETTINDPKIGNQALDQRVSALEGAMKSTVASRDEVTKLENSVQQMQKEREDPLEQFKRLAELNKLVGESFGARLQFEMVDDHRDERMFNQLSSIEQRVALLQGMRDELRHLALHYAGLVEATAGWKEHEVLIQGLAERIAELRRQTSHLATKEQLDANVEELEVELKAALKSYYEELAALNRTIEVVIKWEEAPYQAQRSFGVQKYSVAPGVFVYRCYDQIHRIGYVWVDRNTLVDHGRWPVPSLYPRP